jgi:hephaestin
MKRLAASVALAALGLLTGCSGSSSAPAPGTTSHSTGHPTAAATESSASARTGVERTYFIAADEVRWDYAPLGHDGITGKPFDEGADVFVRPGPNRIGSTYRKCIYRGYTDGSFDERAPRPDDEAYLGLLGPVIRAAVGDTIRVAFRNNCSFPASVHPHGVFYGKASEGAPYADGTGGAAKRDDAVPPGGTHTYRWKVPERAGPGPMDGSSVMWMYHSHTNEIEDTYSGLMGPLVVTAADQARADGSPKDVDRELFHLFAVMNENQSHYLEHEVDDLAEPPHDPEGDEEFAESNLMHSVNGYVFGNGPVPTVHKGESVRWYVMAMGTEVDLHTPHWHGNTVLVGGMRMDAVDLLPASMVVADMTPDDPGTWLFHCHVNDHIAAGMQALYRVAA